MSDTEPRTLSLEGTVRIDAIERLRSSCQEMLAESVGAVRLDLERVDYLDGAAVQLLLAFARAVREAGGTFAVVGEPSEKLAETLAAVGASAVLVGGDANG